MNILGKQISEAGSSKQDFGSFDLAKALKKRLGAK